MAAYDDTSWQQDDDESNPKPYNNDSNTFESANDKTEIVKQGWIMKRGPQSFNGWKKRYLRLSSDQQLTYFTDDALTEVKGMISLEGLNIYSVQKSSKSADSNHFGFSVDTPSRTYLFCVSRSKDRDEWIQKIRGIVDKTSNVYGSSSGASKSQPKNRNAATIDDSECLKPHLAQKRMVQSKYQRRNQQEVLTEEEAKERIADLEQRNDVLLDEALMTSYETVNKATDTAETLSAQRAQLVNTDKMLHEMDQDLDKTDGILKGMKSWRGMIKKKFQKEKERDAYVNPLSEKSTFERRKKGVRGGLDTDDTNAYGHMQSSVADTEINEYDQKQNMKLDELLGNVKQMGQIANDINTELDEQNQMIDGISRKMDKVQPKMEKQNYTMKKLVQ